MVLKRLFEDKGEEEEEEDGSLVKQSKRPRLLFNVMREVVVAQSMQRHLSKLEPFLRRVVQEEVQTAVYRHLHPSTRLPVDRILPAVSRPYHRLLFQNRLPATLFTSSRIEAECRMPVQVVIIDTDSNEVIVSGPLSTSKIEILVLDGDFGDGQEEWTEEEFSESIVREREGKRPLLTGELIITMHNGIGYLADATFTDNSSWIRSRKFRLGARVLQSKITEGRVHEAITEAFLVKDHRGELYKKHHPPALFDDVWRLEKIGKDGAFHKRLAESGVNSVRDFLRFLVLDQDKLRTLLGCGMSNKIWEVTVDHARECVLDDKIYSYCRGSGIALFFNSIFQIIGTRFEHHFLPLDSLTDSQKILVNKLKELAYKNPKDIVEFSEPLLARPQKTLHEINVDDSFRSACLLGPCNSELFATHKDETTTQLGFQHQAHGPFNELLGDLSTAQGLNPVQRFGSVQTDSNSFNIRDYLQPGDFHGTSALSGSTENLLGFNSEADFLSPSPQPIVWDNGNGPIEAPGARWDHLSGPIKAMGSQMGWTQIPRLPLMGPSSPRVTG